MYMYIVVHISIHSTTIHNVGGFYNCTQAMRSAADNPHCECFWPYYRSQGKIDRQDVFLPELPYQMQLLSRNALSVERNISTYSELFFISTVELGTDEQYIHYAV